MEVEQCEQILRFPSPAWCFRKAVAGARTWPMAFLHQTEGAGMTEERSKKPYKGPSCGRSPSWSARTVLLLLYPVPLMEVPQLGGQSNCSFYPWVSFFFFSFLKLDCLFLFFKNSLYILLQMLCQKCDWHFFFFLLVRGLSFQFNSILHRARGFSFH